MLLDTSETLPKAVGTCKLEEPRQKVTYAIVTALLSLFVRAVVWDVNVAPVN